MRPLRYSRVLSGVSVALGAVLVLAGCTPSGGTDSKITLTMRLWDDKAAAAYKTAAAEYSKSNPNVTVTVNVTPWANYFTKLRTDVAGGNSDDVFWLNSVNTIDYARAGDLINIDDALGANATAIKNDWAPFVTKQFTVDQKLYGVPQLSDGGIALFYNKDLLTAAGLSPADLANLTWSPDGKSNSLLTVAQKLTKDAGGHTADQPGFDAAKVVQYGYSANQVGQAMLLPFVGSNGGSVQNQDDGTFTWTNPKTVEAIQYLVDLINKYHVAPNAADTSANGNYARDQFTQGKIAMFQSGLYDLGQVASTAKFTWGTAILPSGPAGAVSTTNGIAVVGNSKSKKLPEVKKFLLWLGTKDGNAAIGSSGANLPAVLSAQQGYFDLWKGKSVDVTPFMQVVRPPATIIPPFTGAKYQAAYTAYNPIMTQVFTGQVPVATGLQQAQDAANKVVNGG